MALSAELREREHRSDTSYAKDTAIRLEPQRLHERVADKEVAGDADEMSRWWVIPAA